MGKCVFIGVSGKARAGKDTFSDFLLDIIISKYNKTVIKVAYADELKRKIMNEFDLSWEQLYGDLKEVPDKRYPKKSLINKLNNKEDGKVWQDKDLYWTPREIMQFIGTDCYREVDNEFWVKSLFKSVNPEEYDFIIVSDCRFESEIDPIVLAGGYHVNINRENSDSITNNSHKSETSLGDGYKVDFYIQNNGNLQDLNKTAEDIMRIIEESSFFNKKEAHSYGFTLGSGGD